MQDRESKRRAVILVDATPVGGRPKLWAYGYDGLAKLFGTTPAAIQKRVRRGGFDPSDLKSICEEWVRRAGVMEIWIVDCRYCGKPLLFVHGHYQCDNRQCMHYGQNQVPCCEGGSGQEVVDPGAGGSGADMGGADGGPFGGDSS